MPARVEELVVALAGFGGSIELRGGSRLSVPALHYVDESEGRSLACRLLESLQEAVATGDVDAVMTLFTDDPTRFGTAGTNLDEKAVRSYVKKMLDRFAGLGTTSCLSALRATSC